MGAQKWEDVREHFIAAGWGSAFVLILSAATYLAWN